MRYNIEFFLVFIFCITAIKSATVNKSDSDDYNKTMDESKREENGKSSNLDLAILDPEKIPQLQGNQFPPFVPGRSHSGFQFPPYPFTGSFGKPSGPSFKHIGKHISKSGFLEYCETNYDCDDGSTTLLNCELNKCRCPVGKYSSRFGGIVITSSWSPLFNRCEARTNADCNINGNGITCLNEQSCNQLEDRPTGIGCCGDGCADDAGPLKMQLNPYYLISIIAITYAIFT